MRLIFAEPAWQDYVYWQTQDKQKLKRINQLIQEIMREPFSGIGKPEPLKHALQGYWSRRINSEHRMVYKVLEGVIFLAQLRYHYQAQQGVYGSHRLSIRQTLKNSASVQAARQPRYIRRDRLLGGPHAKFGGLWGLTKCQAP